MEDYFKYDTRFIFLKYFLNKKFLNSETESSSSEYEYEETYTLR